METGRIGYWYKGKNEKLKKEAKPQSQPLASHTASIYVCMYVCVLATTLKNSLPPSQQPPARSLVLNDLYTCHATGSAHHHTA
jgi:hypothetical protein